jgi:hypothetical protein
MTTIIAPPHTAKTHQFDFLSENDERALLGFIQCLIVNNGNLESAKTAFTATAKLRKLISPRQRAEFLAAAETKLNDLEKDRKNAKTTVSPNIVRKFDELQSNLSCIRIEINSNTYPASDSDLQKSAETLRSILQEKGFFGREVKILQNRRLVAQGRIDPQSVNLYSPLKLV